jgi:hypothetical protein
MRNVLIVLVAAVALLPAASMAQAPITGTVPSGGGVGVVMFAGGSMGDLEQAAAGQGCGLQSVWVTHGGTMLGHVTGAPPFVNQSFTSTVGSTLAPGTPVLLVCAPGGAPPPPPAAAPVPVFDLLLSPADFPSHIGVPFEECFTLAGDVYAGRTFHEEIGEIRFGAATLAHVDSVVLVYANVVLAQGDFQQERAAAASLDDEYLTALFQQVFSVGFDDDEPNPFAGISVSHTFLDLPGLGDGGYYVSMEIDFSALAEELEIDTDVRVTVETIAVRVGRMILTVNTTQEAGGFVPVAQSMIGLLIPRAQAVSAQGVDSAGCVPW